MRWITFLGAVGLVFGVVLLGAGFVWSSAGGPPVAASARQPGGLPTNTPTASPSLTITPAGGTVTPTPTTAPPTASPSETATPAGGTATSSPTTSPTVAATPTACLIYFVDVPPDNTFYAYVRCLSCRGIVGGYPCGGPGEPCPGQYYRPGNNVTRGQTSKIVALAAQFADPVPPGQQTFEDVPSGSTFWLYIEQLAGRGIIGGYPCGGPFEPCQPPMNRPYFRPNNNVTRGQLSKIVSGAAGYTETPTGQTFEDVPPGSTFYLWVERLSSRGIIGGYPCGGAGEPCVPPGSRPYFRPNANATRGQMSKIAASTFTLAWSVVPSLDGGPSAKVLLGVAVVSTDDVWAVGAYSNGNPTQTLVEHWNGTSWSIVPDPGAGRSFSVLRSVTVVSTNDVWAVGDYTDSNLIKLTLIEHWNGASWSIVLSPNVGTRDNFLFGVAAVSASDVWAVGSYTNTGSGSRTLVEHWDGTTWSVVPSPNVGPNSHFLNSVAVGSAGDVWAVGTYINAIGSPNQTVVEHWDGTSWSIVPSPSPAIYENTLNGVAVVSASDVWAVGAYSDGLSPGGDLVEHWNGTNWSLVPSPAEVGSNTLTSVTAGSAGDVWAVGYAQGMNSYHTLVEHWNGTRWRVVSSPNIGVDEDVLRGVAAVGPGDVWAVGSSFGGNHYQTLVEHYAPACP